MRWRAVALRCGLVLAGILAPLLLLEVVLRTIDAPVEIFNPLNGFNVGDARLGWKGRPDIDRRFRKLPFDSRVRHAANGFREPDAAPSATASENILVLGDSYVWGWGVSQGELLTDWLQRAAGPDTAIHNRGVNAYGTAQELLLLEDELERRRYAKVILLFCVNDFGDNVDGKPHRPRFELREGRPVAVNLPLAGKLQSGLEEWVDEHSRVSSFVSYQLALLKERWRQRAHDDQPAVRPASAADPPSSPPGSEITRALLLAMAERARSAGAEFVVAYIPVPEDVRGELGATYADTTRRELESIAHDGGFRFVDLAPSFREGVAAGDVLFIAGDGHFTAAGQQLAARVLEESVLQRRPWSRTSPSPLLATAAPERYGDSDRLDARLLGAARCRYDFPGTQTTEVPRCRTRSSAKRARRTNDSSPCATRSTRARSHGRCSPTSSPRTPPTSTPRGVASRGARRSASSSSSRWPGSPGTAGRRPRTGSWSTARAS